MSAQQLPDAAIIDGRGKSVVEFPGEVLVEHMKRYGWVVLRAVDGDKASFLSLTKRLAPGVERGVAPGEGSLDFHGEIYYTPWPPDVLWFYCACPATRDGQTLLCDGIELLTSMSAEAQRFFANNSLVYEMAWAPEAWAPYFNTMQKEAVIDHLASWTSVTAKFVDDTLYTRFTTAAIRKTKWGEAPAFVNSLLHALDDVRGLEHGRYGLQTQIPSAIVSELRDLAPRLAHAIEWKQGDIAMIDNTRMMHARRPFEGIREIIAVNGYALF